VGLIISQHEGVRVGRPPKDIDADQVFRLARLGLTQADIAEVFDVSQSVISERFRSEFTRARGHWKLSLRLAQWKRAKAGSDAMLIHLGKSVLGQTYKLDITAKGGLPTVVCFERAHNPRDAESDAELDGWAKQRVKAMTDRLARENNSDVTALHFDENGFGDATVVVLPAKESGLDDPCPLDEHGNVIDV
jgi:hypothetical protein